MLEGGIREINLVERLIELWRENFTGAIRFENDGIIKIIYFKTGDVLSASTNDRADSVDEILMRAGKVSREHVKQALAKRKENETLGDALLNLGFITRKELTWGRRVQVINVIRSVSEWPAGTFTIVADYLPKREEGTNFPLPQLIVELIVTDADRNKFEKALESGSAVFAKAADADQKFRALGLNEDAEAVMKQVDGQRSASEVAATARQDTFNSFKLLHALSLLGILQRQGVAAPVAAPAPAAISSDSFEDAGVADASEAWSSGSMPKFDLDDAPSMAPLPGMPDVADIGALPEPEPPAPAPAMPAWDPPASIQTPPPASSIPMPGPVEEQQWGFDEAQIETAKKAAAASAAAKRPNLFDEPEPVPPPVAIPEPPKAVPRRTMAGTSSIGTSTMGGTSTMRKSPYKAPPPKRSRFGLILTLMVVFILAGASYYGYTWWQGRQSGTADAQPIARPKPTPPRPVTQTAQTTQTMTQTVAPPVTATTASVAPPVTKKKTIDVPAPVPQPTRPRPTSTAGASYEEMAREFAANPAGNFTVQFAIVCEPSNVTKALNSGGSNVWFVPISIKGRSCYRMYWGRFATREEADRGMVGLPAALRESKPAVVAIAR